MSRSNQVELKVEDLSFFKVRQLWQYFWSEHPAFWFICAYLFFEYFRPQAIYPAIDVLPWAQSFLAGAIVAQFFDKKSRLQWCWTHTWLLLFALQIKLSFFFAYDPSWSERYQIQYLQWIIIYFLVCQIVTTKERFYVFLLVFIICSLKISIGTAVVFASRGFSFTSWGLMGPPGYFQNSGELAIQMVVQFCLAIYLMRAYWKKSNRFERLILLATLITPALTIMGASSRGSQLALVAVLIYYFRWSLFKPKILVSFSIILAMLWVILPEEQLGRFQNMGEDQTSVQRMLYWTNGIDMIADHPMTGVGYYNFIPYYTDVYPNDMHFVNRQGERVAELPHNIFIQIGTDAGVPALMFYILIVLSLKSRNKVQSDWVAFKEIHAGLYLGVVGFLIAGQFVTVGYYPFFWVSAALITSIKQTLLTSKKERDLSQAAS
ncbi:O-antigen ligase family protein [Reinekea blandensis]|uniref:Lipid A core-O-antigen ligase and related enzyme n=1 Tax=Reinekea blandensis MED297 TaxID=314283 RepID=A4B946_9GAMM|nr:O-antigen ligase family protein [Reinekea blandensis]EAR11147.1 Lipid A core - O-antigen ligase and related enzyme [Reinekea sp. MED297] [Reinekea blandensis MED297]